MGRGNRKQQESAPVLSGDALINKLYIARPATDNWARFREGPENTIAARQAFLADIRDNGVFSKDPPEWMTSGKPGVDSWIFLPGNVVVMIAHQPHGGRPWTAKNTSAPRRGSNRKQTEGKATTKQQLTQQQLEELQGLDSAGRTKAITCSRHARERLADRLQLSMADVEPLKQQIWQDGEIMHAPAWANASGHGDPVLLWSGSVNDHEQQIAVLLAPDVRHPDKAMATTALSYEWVKADLLDMPSPSKMIAISDSIKQAMGAAVSEMDNGNGQLEPSPGWQLPSGTVRLRPAADAQRNAGVRYIAVAWEPATS